MYKFKRIYQVATSILFALLATALAAQAQTFITLHDFVSTDGSQPGGPMIQATDGNLYGTTAEGGANHNKGTIYKVSPAGVLRTLYSFCAQSNCADGSRPLGVIQATDGNFYGTTEYSGANGFGTAFKITAGGSLTTLYSFCAEPGCTDGGNPGRLVEDTEGNLYGVTAYGGNGGPCGVGCGTIFRITPAGTLTTLHSFCTESGCTDGENPSGPPVQATDGDFYGLTFDGGANNAGVIFKMSPSGSSTVLYNLCSQGGGDCTDGAYGGSLIQATDGNFYGTTQSGGAYGGGTIFRMTPSGALSTLYSFCSSSCEDGALPNGLIEATDGNLYGTTQSSLNGAVGGTVFRVSPTGTLASLHRFGLDNAPGGSDPAAPVTQDTNGIFYGTTVTGGKIVCSFGCGTLFSLTVGLRPFVDPQTTSGKVGAAVNILGTDLTGATSVTFNGTAATFTVVSPSLITTTVPAGATTGAVQVVTPGGTLSSNVPFRVIQ